MWAVSPEIGASHRVPQKNKWVSCLSVVRYWVSSLECCQCAKVAGGGAECSLVFLTWWDRLEGKGGWEDPLQATLTNTPKKQHCLLSNVLDEHTTLTRHKHVHLSTCLEPALYCPIAAFCCFPVILKGRAQILYSVTSVIYFQSRQEQSWRNHGDEWMTFLFFIRDKWAVDRRERGRERENNRERSLLWYSDYIRPFWQTNVLVPNSEWLSEWPEGVSATFSWSLCHSEHSQQRSFQHVCNSKRMDVGPWIAHLQLLKCKAEVCVCVWGHLWEAC